MDSAPAVLKLSFHNASVSEKLYGAVPVHSGQHSGKYNGKYSGQRNNKYSGPVLWPAQWPDLAIWPVQVANTWPAQWPAQ